MKNGTLQQQGPLTYEQAEIIQQFRVLISKLTYLTRYYIIAELTGLGSPDAIVDELSRIPIEGNRLTDTVPGFQGDFAPITEAYVQGIQGLIDGMTSSDQEQADESIRQLYAIADQNAVRLAEMSPYWDEDTWRAIFYDDISNLTQEVIAIETKEFHKAIDIFQIMMEKALAKADYYAGGIIHFLPEDQEQIPIPYFNMVNDFRNIFTQIAYLTLFYIASRITGLGEAEEIKERFSAIPVQIKEKVQPILRAEITNEFLNLLSIYLLQLEQIVDAIMSGDPVNIETQRNELYQHSNEMVAYLGSINPYWDENKWVELLSVINKYILQQIYELQSGDFVEAIRTFEGLLFSLLAAADYFALGLYQYELL